MRLVRLPSFRIQIGEPLPWNIRNGSSRLLLARGSTVESKEQLAAMMAHGIYINIAEIQAQYRKQLAAAAKPEKPEPLITSTLKGPTSIFGLWEASPVEMQKFMGNPLDTLPTPAQITDFLIYLIELVNKNVDLALYYMVRQESRHLYYYGYNHSIHTAVLCLLVTRRLGWSPKRVISLMKAALTMNMSILQLQGAMAMQDGPLQENQRVQIRAHPLQAVEWLRKMGVTDPDWLTAVAQHHEQPNGQGYPLGITDIGEVASVLRIADVFMAKISPRKLRASLSIQEAARQLFNEDRGGPLSSAVVKEFGIYPPGEVVRLASGEIGVVIRRTDSVKFPIVAAITDSAGRPSVHTVQRDTSDPSYAVITCEIDKSLVANLPPERLYGYTVSTLQAKGELNAAEKNSTALP